MLLQFLVPCPLQFRHDILEGVVFLPSGALVSPPALDSKEKPTIVVRRRIRV